MQAMKKMFKLMLPGALALAFVAAPAVVPTALAQDTAATTANPNQAEKERLDKLFRDNFKNNKDVAYQAAKDYLAKFGSDTDNQEFVTYLKNWITKEEQRRTGEAQAAIAKRCADPVAAAAKAPTAAEKAKFGSDVFSGCQQFASQAPNTAYAYLVPVDYGFILATSNPPINTYNEQTIALAKQAIQKMESNQFTDVKWSDYQFKSKDDALGWMNYIIGFITFYNMNGREADAVPYFYKSLQYDSDVKKKFQPYYGLGFNYRTQYNKAVQEFQTKSAGATEMTDELKRDLGMQKALADRAIDAFARALAVAKADPKTPKAVVDARQKDLEQMFKIRNNQQTTGMDTFVAGVMSKPLPDPNAPVTPVIEETTGTAASNAAAMTSAGTGSAKETSGSETRAATTTTTKTTTTTSATTTAKPAPKPAAAPKKPTRKPTRQ